MKTRIILVRHGETKSNLRLKFSGCEEAKLSDEGLIQAKKVANRLKEEKIDCIITSLFSRACRTATEIATKQEVVGNKPQKLVSDKLREIDFGSWEKELHQDISEKNPLEYYIWETKAYKAKFPNGDSVKEYCEKVAETIDEIVDKYQGKTVCLSTHGFFIRAAMLHLKGLPIERLDEMKWPSNTSVSIADIETKGKDKKINIVLDSDNSHIPKQAKKVNVDDMSKYIRNAEQKVKQMGITI